MECHLYGKRTSYLKNIIYKATKCSISNIREDSVHRLVGGELVVPREKSPPAMSIILSTILRDSFVRVEQSLQEGLNNMTKVRDWSVMFLLLRLPMVHGWMIHTEGIVQNILIGEHIYEKKIVSEMEIFAKASPIHENSMQPLKIVVIFFSDQI